MRVLNTIFHAPMNNPQLYYIQNVLKSRYQEIERSSRDYMFFACYGQPTQITCASIKKFGDGKCHELRTSLFKKFMEPEHIP